MRWMDEQVSFWKGQISLLTIQVQEVQSFPVIAKEGRLLLDIIQRDAYVNIHEKNNAGFLLYLPQGDHNIIKLITTLNIDEGTQDQLTAIVEI